MKIGLLTMPLYTNIGGILQAYALQCVLEKLGHSVTMLSERPTKWRAVKNFIKKILIFFSIKKITREQADSLKFVKKRFRSWFFFNSKSKKEMVAFGALVVGSDQVWRPWGGTWNFYQYFFDFAESLPVPKYAYAVSFGKENWMYSDQTTKKLIKLAKKFTRISVRENDAVMLCDKYLKVNAEWVLDPTMLLEKKDYERLIDCEIRENLGLVCYFIGENAENRNFLRDSLNLTAKYFDDRWIMAKSSSFFNKSGLGSPMIENWLHNMMNATFVLTNSFHGVAFSINFEKPFIVLALDGGGVSRIKSILSMFGLENRLVRNLEDISKVVNEKIDWNRISDIKEKRRKESIDFLKGI